MTIARCSCGALLVALTGAPVRISACHCLACQRRTGGAFGVAAFYERSQAEVRGASSVYTRDGDSGLPLDFHFCPACGSTVFWRAAFRPHLIAIALGCFEGDKPGPPEKQVYLEHKLEWVTLEVGEGRPARLATRRPRPGPARIEQP